MSAFRQPTLTTWTDLEDGMVYIDIPTYPPPAPLVQTPPSPEWTSSSLPIFPSPSIVPLPVSSPILPLTAPSPVGENWDLWLQLVEERHARLELAEVIDSMRRGQELRG
ncbi:hypothetical protein Tco_0175945, partial [Tanacetum coccineum]